MSKSALIELNHHRPSQIRVAGPNESWVTGRARNLRDRLRVYENRPLTIYRRHGLAINQVLFLAMIVIVPGLRALWERMAFVGGVTLILLALLIVYNGLFPNTMLLLTDKKPGLFSRLWPQLLALAITAGGGLLAALLYGLIKSSPAP